MRIIPFTKTGYEDLKIKLEKEISKRPEAVKSLTKGREMGDLSENGLYKAAKQELADIDRQIRYLKNLVHQGKPVIPVSNDYVQLGHRVKIKTGTLEKEFLIVGEYEANPEENKISLKSPIGHNLMGRKIGDQISVRTPNGFIQYTILAIK